ncbi:hypothetical protein BH24CHL1_BH24CHL1_07300 [soil metagenome]
MVRRIRISQRAFPLFISIVVILSMLLAACGNDDEGDSDMAITSQDSVAPQAASSDEEAQASTSEFRGSVEQAESEPAAGQLALDRLVIRTAQITLTVDDTLSATGSVRNLAITKGGFVFSSTTYTEDDRQYAQLTLRVPAERFDETISDLRTAAYVVEVEREESSSQDVSAEFIDNESRLTALEETQRRYLALLSEADTVDEILRLERELTDVRSQIETIKGRQNYLSEMTSFSTITVTLRPDGETEDEPDGGMAVTRIFESAWERSIGALAGIAEAVIVIAIFAAFFVPLSIGTYALYRAARRVTARIAE